MHYVTLMLNHSRKRTNDKKMKSFVREVAIHLTDEQNFVEIGLENTSRIFLSKDFIEDVKEFIEDEEDKQTNLSAFIHDKEKSVEFEKMIKELFKLKEERELLRKRFFTEKLSATIKGRIQNHINLIDEKIGYTRQLIQKFREDKDDKKSGENENNKNEELKETSNLLCNIKPRISFGNIILPNHTKETIFSVLSQIKNSKTIFEEWGLKNTIPYGKGIILLFTGLPGTGKTLAAEAIAKEFEKELSVINYEQLQSRWVGDTEKNICEIFKEAKKTGNILLIDEADALISQRIGIYNSASVYQNSEKSHFLKELEKFEGIVIMTTNMASNLDKALERRLCATILFEIPNPEQRKKIWELIIGKKMPLAKDVNFSKLAKKYEFSGGHIKNAILGAARIAAMKRSKTVSMEHFEKAAEQVLKGQGILQNSYLSKKEKQVYMG